MTRSKQAVQDIAIWEREIDEELDRPAPDLLRISDRRNWINEAWGLVDYSDLDEVAA